MTPELSGANAHDESGRQKTRSGMRAMRWGQDALFAFQFLTRLPLPRLPFDEGSLSRAAGFFPLVGLVLGLAAAGVSYVLVPHLGRVTAAKLVVVFLVVITGALHEDGLADAADGFGGGWGREQVLSIMRDSRIGSYGAIALVLTLLLRVGLLAEIPVNRWLPCIVSAHVLCRWTTLPLSVVLNAARSDDGQGARIAQKISRGSLLFGSLFSCAICVYFLHGVFWAPVLAACAVTLATGLYYKHRIGGVTGDCFGLTNQLTEIAIYLCGVWC